MTCNCELEILHILFNGEIYCPELNKDIVSLYLDNRLFENLILKELINGAISYRSAKGSEMRIITNRNRDSYIEYLI